MLDRLKTTIAEVGYEAVVEDLLSPDLVGGEHSLLASDDVMVVPGHLADSARPILLAVTKGWNGKEPHSFARVMRQVKARLIESRGTIQVVIVFWGKGVRSRSWLPDADHSSRNLYTYQYRRDLQKGVWGGSSFVPLTGPTSGCRSLGQTRTMPHSNPS
jgi:hypothetical protein